MHSPDGSLDLDGCQDSFLHNPSIVALTKCVPEMLQENMEASCDKLYQADVSHVM